MGKIATVNPFLDIDLLSDARSSAYFVMKDALIHFFSLRSVEYRRDFNLEVAAALDAFASLPKKDRGALHEAYTIGYERVTSSFACPKLSDRRDATIINIPMAKNFFCRDDLTNSDTLKSAYRKQTKIDHPDVGGSHNAMLSLNDVFNALSEVIASGQTNTSPFGTTEGNFKESGDWVEVDTTPMPHSTWCGWLGPLVWGTFSHGFRVFRPVDADRALLQLRASVAIDEYELIEATGFMRTVLGQKLTNGPRGFGLNAAIIEASIQLCRRLRASRLDAEAEEIALMLGISNLKSHQYWWHMSKELDIIMLRDVRPKVNPLHPRQRANWERYLSQKKTGTADRLLTARQANDTKFRSAVSALGRFMDLTQDPSKPQLASLTVGRIPQPNPWTLINSEQVHEYHFAFYQNPSLDLVKKHLSLRCDMWCYALFDVDIPLGRLLAEIRTVAEFIPQTLHRTPSRQRIESLLPRFTFLDFIDYLLDLPPEEARNRLDLLAAIDNQYATAIRGHVSTHHMQNSNILRSGISFRDISFPDVRDTFFREKPEQLSLSGQLTLNPVLVRSWRKEWFKAACAPIGQLEEALETGWMTRREESIKRAWQRCGDYLSTHALTQKLWWEDGAKEAFEGQNDSRFVLIAKNSIEACFKHMAQTEFVEELYMGWWLESLAKVFLRAGNSDAARSLAVQYFELPVRAHAWTTENEMAFLKRLSGSPPKE